MLVFRGRNPGGQVAGLGWGGGTISAFRRRVRQPYSLPGLVRVWLLQFDSAWTPIPARLVASIQRLCLAAWTKLDQHRILDIWEIVSSNDDNCQVTARSIHTTGSGWWFEPQWLMVLIGGALLLLFVMMRK